MNLNSGPKIASYVKFELDQVIILKLIQVSLFFNPKSQWFAVDVTVQKNI